MRGDEWDERYAERELLWSATPNRFLVSEVEGLRPGRALDLACGEGRNAIWLAERGWRVTAVDFSRVAIERAGRLAAERGVEVDFLCADLLAYEPPVRTFDLVAVFYLQLPADELSPVLARAAEAVAAGGTLLVVGHDLVNLTEGYGGPKDPAVLFTPDDVVRAASGLAVERAERVRRPVELEDGTAVEAIDALVRLRRDEG